MARVVKPKFLISLNNAVLGDGSGEAQILPDRPKNEAFRKVQESLMQTFPLHGTSNEGTNMLGAVKSRTLLSPTPYNPQFISIDPMQNPYLSYLFDKVSEGSARVHQEWQDRQRLRGKLVRHKNVLNEMSCTLPFQSEQVLDDLEDLATYGDMIMTGQQDMESPLDLSDGLNNMVKQMIPKTDLVARAMNGIVDQTVNGLKGFMGGPLPSKALEVFSASVASGISGMFGSAAPAGREAVTGPLPGWVDPSKLEGSESFRGPDSLRLVLNQATGEAMSFIQINGEDDLEVQRLLELASDEISSKVSEKIHGVERELDRVQRKIHGKINKIQTFSRQVMNGAAMLKAGGDLLIPLFGKIKTFGDLGKWSWKIGPFSPEGAQLLAPLLKDPMASAVLQAAAIIVEDLQGGGHASGGYQGEIPTGPLPDWAGPGKPGWPEEGQTAAASGAATWAPLPSDVLQAGDVVTQRNQS